MQINVLSYSADPTGTTDSTAAFNAAASAVYATLTSPSGGEPYLTKQLLIPPGVYLVDSVNLTGKLARNFHIIGHGAVLKSRTAGKAVLDCTNSRWINVHGLTIHGDSSAIPRCGIQLGPKGTETSGNCVFDNVNVIGNYSLAALLNTGCETTQYSYCRFSNVLTTGSYAAIFDGASTYLPQSDYATVTRTSGTAVSFTNNSSYSCQYRNEGGGAAVYVAGSNTHTFDRGCYFLSFNAAALDLYGTGTVRNSNLRVDGLFESAQTDTPTAGNTGIKYVCRFIGNNTNGAIEGFFMQTQQPHAAEAILYNDNGSATIRLSSVRIDVQTLLNASATFFKGAGITLHGDIMTRTAAKLNLGQLVAYTGKVVCDSALALASLPPAGGWEVVSTGDNKIYKSSSAGALLQVTPG